MCEQLAKDHCRELNPLTADHLSSAIPTYHMPLVSSNCPSRNCKVPIQWPLSFWTL